MPISGLVVSLSADATQRDAAKSKIAADPRVQLGESAPQRLAIALETATEDEDRHFWRWLNAISGVEFVEVAFIGFDTDSEQLNQTQ